MKITFVLSALTIGGGARVIFEYANRLQERGHEVFIIYPLIPASPLNILKRQGLKDAIRKYMLSLNKSKFKFKTTATLIKVPLLSPKLLNYKISDGDAVIATDFNTVYPVAKLREVKGKKYHFVQGYEISECWNNERCWERAKEIEEDPNKLCLAMADIDTSDLTCHNIKKLIDNTFKLPLRKITISTWLKELLEKKFGQKVEGVIINSVNFEIFRCKNKRFNIGTKRILATYASLKFKGAEDAIKAFKLVKAQYPDIEFVMYGLVKGNIPPWIKFYENPSDEKLRELYCSSDIFVSPSWVEGFGLPSMEAMACKCAVVATEVGGIPDYAIPGKTVLTAPIREPISLAENIMELLEYEEKLKAISESGYEYIKKFTWEKATDKLENILLK